MTSARDTSSPRPSEELVDAVVTTALTVSAVITKLGAENELSATLVRVLGLLWDRESRVTQLAEHLGVEKQTMSGLVSRAQQRGLVSRVQNPDDGRAADIQLTSRGREVVARLRVRGQEALMPLFADMTPSEHDTLAALLRRMLKG